MQASYVWTEQYQAAILELDSEKLAAQITRAEAAIQQREVELLRESPVGPDELQAIAKALRVLTLLRDIAEKRA